MNQRPRPSASTRRFPVWGRLALTAGFALACACGQQGPSLLACEDKGSIHAICGLQNPEDMARIPGDPHVVIGQGDGMEGGRAGNLALFHPETEEVRIVYPGPGAAPGPKLNGAWGDALCPGAPDASFSPHGIDLAPLPDGRLRLLVVNHGGGERVEFFEVIPAEPMPRVVWRGCAVPDSGTFFNDVVNLPDGGFLGTHMMERDGRGMGTFRGLLGLDTGFVYEWQPGVGFKKLPGTGGALPNGIEISPDGKALYLNLYLDDEVRHIERASGKLLGVASVPGPDNVTWDEHGNLLVASHIGSVFASIGCMDLKEGACPMAFQVVRLDPESLESEVIFSHEGAPMGAGTVALDIGDEMLIGSFASDRMLRVASPNPEGEGP